MMVLLIFLHPHLDNLPIQALVARQQPIKHPHTHTHTYTPCSTVIMASVVGGIGASSIAPLILATILAYCVTGYVRDELYHPFVKTCVGPFCNILVRNIGIGTMGFVPPNIQF